MIFFSGCFVSKEIDGDSRCLKAQMLDHRSSVPGNGESPTSSRIQIADIGLLLYITNSTTRFFHTVPLAVQYPSLATMSATTTRSTWHLLPTELKLAVVESLTNGDIKSLSRVDQRTYQRASLLFSRSVHPFFFHYCVLTYRRLYV